MSSKPVQSKAANASKANVTANKQQNGETMNRNERTQDIRSTNIIAANAVADVIRTSLGPRGMDKMIQDAKRHVIITNDGATILKQMDVLHPTAKMLVEISKAQDIEAGDGTTSVAVIAGSLLNACESLLEKQIHPTTISEGFIRAEAKAQEILKTLATTVDLDDREQLIQCVNTSLSSKVISTNSKELSPLAVDAVLKVINKDKTNVDLRDIKVTKKVGGTIEETQMVNGLVFPDNKPAHSAGGPSKITNAKIAILQFCLSSPKTDMENQIVVQDYTAMDRILKEEKKYIAGMIKKITASGANVLLIQKSILRDATNDLSLHFLAKKGIMVVKDIEREEVEFISKTIGAVPVAHIDNLTPEKLGRADLCHEERQNDEGLVFKITGVPNASETVSILVRGSNRLVLDEAERSLHDALCVVRSLVKNRGLIPGGGAPEIEIAQKMTEYARTLEGLDSMIFRAYADALEIIPYTLAENAGLNPIEVVTELRNRHQKGEKRAGISIRKGAVSDNITLENVLQPALVTSSALSLSTECVRMILKIDDLVFSR